MCTYEFFKKCLEPIYAKYCKLELKDLLFICYKISVKVAAVLSKKSRCVQVSGIGITGQKKIWMSLNSKVKACSKRQKNPICNSKVLFW